MINKKLILLLIFLTCAVKAQTFTGIYIFKFNSAVSSQTYNNLVSSQNKTWFVETKLESLTAPNVEKITKDGVTIENVSDDYKNIIPTSSPEYYKDEQSNNLYSRNFYLTKACYIKENLDQFSWKISEETVNYNGKKCNVATSDFHGKKWTVYFDTSIPFNVAPWKFYGLPGVVVYAKTSDNLYVFELKEYKITGQNTDVKNPLEKEKFITWEGYKTEYKNYLKKLIKKWSADSEDGNGGSIKMGDTIEDLGFSEIK
ncbi:GLPGLI family protein [Chryseobacterium cucumeris]|uniref:GLPGLI family protein n=1 Tax=Chryseobacterium cucumeris TaxID=1813611 RepID=UPI003D99653B